MTVNDRTTANGASMIPGGYEPNTLTHRQPGSMGASPATPMPLSARLTDRATIADREREGGGGPSQRSTGTVGDSADRWRQWYDKYAVASRRDEHRARVVFTIVFATIGLWIATHLIARVFL